MIAIWHRLSTLCGTKHEDRPSREDLRAKMAARGVPDRSVDMALGLYIASRKGEFAPVDPTLERRLGRRPISMRDLIVQKVGS